MTGSWYDALWEEVGSVLHVCLEAMGVWLLAGWLAGWLAGKWDCSVTRNQFGCLSVVDDGLAPSTSTSTSTT
jgi:hypothetical protein